MKELLEWYDKISNKTVEDIIEFHVRFEKIYPFKNEMVIGMFLIYKAYNIYYKDIYTQHVDE